MKKLFLMMTAVLAMSATVAAEDHVMAATRNMDRKKAEVPPEPE